MLTWQLTLSATASARAGDTLRVHALVDSVELLGHRSLYARDPRLHHFLRGLLLSEAREHEQAVREFRAAVSSPSQGYTRINYEMAKSLLALHRPAEAIPVLRSALRGGLEGSGLYLTRTEVHELAARAFAAAGQRDSATFHYAVVERAWRSADPFLADRYDEARQWLLRSGRSMR
jgi:tetratricopeptide (TPR) repeat protein